MPSPHMYLHSFMASSSKPPAAAFQVHVFSDLADLVLIS